MTFLHPEAFFLLPLSAFLWFLEYRGRRSVIAWKTERQPAFDGRAEPNKRKGTNGIASLHSWLLGMASVVLVLALARPVWDPVPIETRALSQDTVFLVDVSRSMESVDLTGAGQGISRLAGVKQSLLNVLPGLAGDRVALVAFAGTSVPKCPLTADYGFFRQSVELLDATSTSRGGTLLGDALRSVKKDFSRPGRMLSVWVFTDGGDQESFPVEAARQFADSGMSLYVWGVGSLGGAQIPGREENSSLNEGLLKSVAEAVPGGLYFGSEFPLWTFSQEYRKHHADTGESVSSRVVWKEGSWWLLWPVLALLALDAFLRRGFAGRKSHR